MRVFFSKSLVGSATDFVWEDEEFKINDSDPVDWSFTRDGPRYHSVLAASEAAGLNLVRTPNIPQAQFWMKHTQHPAWHRILQKSSFGDHLREQVKSVIDFIRSEENSYFTGTYQLQQAVIDSLFPSRVRDNSLSDQGFVPDAEGFVCVPDYDNVHSATGRMSVKSGPRILTLPKDMRSSIRSRWDDGCLLEVDFNSLEVRVLGWITGNELGAGDVYEKIGSIAGFTNTSRLIVKEATLSAIYGMSRRNFALRYQDTPDAVEIYDAIKETMRVRDLDERLRSMKKFANAFGRPLGSTDARISHYVQSSAVDVVCDGFLGLIKQLDRNFCVPVFLIHDALVLDVKQRYIAEVESLCKSGLDINIINTTFPVKVRRFGE